MNLIIKSRRYEAKTGHMQWVYAQGKLDQYKAVSEGRMTGTLPGLKREIEQVFPLDLRENVDIRDL